MSDRLLKQIYETIGQHQMVSPNELVLMAVSGGVDSLALLYSLHALKNRLRCHLHIAHLDHGLRSTSQLDAKFVQKHASSLSLPITTEQANLTNPSEATARSARYNFLDRTAKKIGATKIALGHHKSDQAETVLMKLIRGAGSDGLRGILPIRDGKFIRPLLELSRSQLESFTNHLGLQPISDATNSDVNFTRNRIRLRLLPELKKCYNAKIENAIGQTAKILQAEVYFLNSQALEALEACQIAPGKLDRRKFLELHLALQRRILRLAIAELSGGTRELSFSSIEAVLRLIDGENPNVELQLPNGLFFRRTYEELQFSKFSNDRVHNFEHEITVPGITAIPEVNGKISSKISEIGKPANRSEFGKFSVLFDYGRLVERFPKLNFKLRNRRTGDRFEPFGMSGEKKLKDLFIDRKIPKVKRNSIQILTIDEQILWVVGVRRSNLFNLNAETKKILQFDFIQ